MSDNWLQNILSAPSTQGVALGAIVTLVIVSIIRGWLLPSAIVKQMIALKDKVIESLQQQLTQALARGDEYKATVETQIALIERLTDQNGKLITSGDAADHYFKELARVTRGASDGPHSGGEATTSEGGPRVVAPTD